MGDCAEVAVTATSAKAARIDAEEIARLVDELGPEPRSCLICAAPGPRRLFFRSEKWFWSCNACELVFVHDIYPEFALDVAHLDGTYDFHATRSAKPRELSEYARLLAQFEPVRSTGRLLEVGCGHGIFLEAARARGWNVVGVEILDEVAAIARKARSLDVRVGELAGAAFKDAHFDVVYMNEVIEHVVDPVALMREVRRVLRPGGCAVLRTGNARSWSARLRGRGWSYYRFGGHLHIRFYSPKSAEALARAAGFARARCDTRGFAMRESAELAGHWYKPIVKPLQALVSPLAGPLGAGHRLTMWLESA